MEMSSSSVVLIVADTNFHNLCKDPAEYMTRLKAALAARADKMSTAISLFTISGRFGLTKVDPEFAVIEIDDKNKTAFGQALENASILFEELVTITNTPDDPYMSMVREVATNTSKTMTHYRYERKAA